MRTHTRVAVAIVSVLGIGSISAVVLNSADSRELGRSDPKRAARYILNFSENYTDGVVLGIAVGSTKTEAIQASERAGLTVNPGCWGDNRAGGASLYDKPQLNTAMLRQPHLCFYDADDLRKGLTVDFRGNHVTAIRVYYINIEGT
jgi:hypothetical protein